ncbi:MAG: type II secretion system protein [Candidatus Liptonbacteria bacterium]|nr:type II secretion system protein [Candidatus Liptonbacteria bacterium]
MQKKGFTLIELLVVVAILAILSVVVILTLNPAQLLAQARDSQRLSDMSTINSSIALYLQDVESPSVGAANVCYGSAPTTPNSAGCGGRMSASDPTVTTSTSPASTTGAGWIPINFATINGGSPLGSEPMDPVNSATYFYSYATNASSNYQYEVNANMESTKYSASGTSDVESADGGTNVNIFEMGTNLGL